jgi:hypothetical protein
MKMSLHNCRLHKTHFLIRAQTQGGGEENQAKWVAHGRNESFFLCI